MSVEAQERIDATFEQAQGEIYRLMESLNNMSADSRWHESVSKVFVKWERMPPGSADLEAEGMDAMIGKTPMRKFAHCSILAIAYAAQARTAIIDDDISGAWRQIADAHHWYGAARAFGNMFYAIEASDLKAVIEAMSAKGRKGSKAKLAADPKQHAKAQARVIFFAWQRVTGEGFKSNADFGRKMVARFPVLTDPGVVSGWCASWKHEFKNTR